MTGSRPLPDGSTSSTPTRGDRHLLLMLTLLLSIAASLSPIRNYDYWWHLATGSWILENRTVPHSDPFSFTAGGVDWVDHEWLFQILAYLGHTALGAAGLVVIKVGLVLALCLLMASHLRRAGHGPAGSVVILIPVLLGVSFRLDVRPELATLMLLPLVIHLLLRGRAGGKVGPLIAVPLIVAVWANLHLGVVLAPALLALGLVGTLAAGWLRRGESDERDGPGRPGHFAGRLAWITLAASLAVGLNPYGLRLYTVPFELSRLLRSLPWPNQEWARPSLADFPLFWVCLVAAVVVTLIGIRRADPVATPAMFLAGVLAAVHLRNIGLFFVLLPYGIGGPARALIDRFEMRRVYSFATLGGTLRPGFVGAAVLVVFSVPLLILLPPGVAFGLGVAEHNEPAGAVDFLQREGVGERMFNDVLFGGYLIWRRYPSSRVFVDGRNEVYADLLHEIDAGMRAPQPWEDFIERHGIDAAFLRYPPTLQKVLYAGGAGGAGTAGLRAFSAAYFHRDGWALVYWDDDAMIFLRRLPQYEAVIRRLEYRAIHPDDWRHLYAGASRGQIEIGPIMAEIERKLTEDPSCQRARHLQKRFVTLARALAGSDSAPAGGGR